MSPGGSRAAPWPPEVLRRLLVGGQGRALVAARDAACAGGAALADLADGLALAVWEDAPLDGDAAAVVAARQDARPFLPPELAARVSAVAALARPAGRDAYFERLAARRDVPRMVHYLTERLRKDAHDLAAARGLAEVAPMAATGDETERTLTGLPDVLAPLGLLVAGELALLAGRPKVAEARLCRALADLPSAAGWFRLAEARLALGDRDGAVTALERVVAARPWDALALQRLYTVRFGEDRRLRPLAGPVAVLLYSYRNADRLDRTLAALAGTDWRFAPPGSGPRVVALDNGSPDATAAVLAAWQERLGDTLAVVRLPVNVGAPAARNWLMRLPAVQQAAFAAYLDDDALVPPEWLGRFGAAVDASPGAGVYGCRVRGVEAPHFVQSADSHLWPTPRGTDWGERGFTLLRPWLFTPDWGQYGLCRPCSSVTGCCHLFPTDVLLGAGGFDIRFSPSQYDDLDHDLRLLERGLTAVCTAHLTVRHDKVTGAASGQGGAGYAAGFANQFKLHHKYDDASLARAAATAFAALARDTAAKARRLAGGAATFWEAGRPDATEDGHGG